MNFSQEKTTPQGSGCYPLPGVVVPGARGAGVLGARWLVGATGGGGSAWLGGVLPRVACFVALLAAGLALAVLPTVRAQTPPGPPYGAPPPGSGPLMLGRFTVETITGSLSEPTAFAFYRAIISGDLRRLRYSIPTPPPSGTSYLIDLTWTSATNGWGPVEKDRSNGETAAGDGRTITLNTVSYPKGVGLQAASDVRYYLGGTCSTFTSDMGVDDEAGTAGSVVFKVWADGTKLYDSGVMTGTTATESVSVSLTG